MNVQDMIAQLLGRNESGDTPYLVANALDQPGMRGRPPLPEPPRPRMFRRPEPYTGSGLPSHPIGPGAVMDPPRTMAARILPQEHPGNYPDAESLIAALSGINRGPDVEAPQNGLPGGFPIPGNAPPEPTPPIAVQSSPDALAGALTDMDAMAMEPWTERPDGFLPGLAWDLREELLQRQMRRQLGQRKSAAPRR